MKSLAISVGCGLVLWFIPPPAGVAIKAWKLLSVFVGTIVGIITMVSLHDGRWLPVSVVRSAVNNRQPLHMRADEGTAGMSILKRLGASF
jgi:hypothetical protein